MPLSLLALIGVGAVVLLLGGAIYVRRHWSSQVTRLRGALEQALENQLLIEELQQPYGGVSPLTPALIELLTQRHRQRAEFLRLDQERQQRLATKTDALERTAAKFRAQATRDALTGLYNKRALDQCLDEIVQSCIDQRAPVCLLMIDVDDFKLLNDTLGHPAGDSLLKSIGQLIRSSLKDHEQGFRCGGDEFVVVMPRATREQGEAMARRLRDLVDALAKSLAVARKPRLSIGVSTFSERVGITTGAALLADADQRLYEAKFERKLSPQPVPPMGPPTEWRAA
jgi:diguanylate cyclase (GGDEF)-like protein